ncbi:phosphoglycerate dehydrogenase [Tessaracoccus sp. MC1679]|uniref:NAD(P)-dependent oxidoreductase n=1 Tax=Tessaracoccus sp. MC1679 TaxID=2760313 RepID=UPI001602EF29|nr:NAD(P)-dependent oxidoreductase [Tessaracoccus sp. MC1679]MBB1516737.1 phosphoglycerate dehydrogenase [Tessaracoccus sp. MC1679]
MKILIPDTYTGPLPRIDGAEVVVVPGDRPVPEEHVDAEVLVVWGQSDDVLPDAARRMTSLLLVQGLAAGPDNVRAAGFPPGVMLSSGVGLHDGPVAEHALALTLALVRMLPMAMRNQHDHLWDGELGGAMLERAHDGRIISLDGAKVTIWGFGSIAARLAPLLRALGAWVTGIARSTGPRHGFDVFDEDALPEVLADTDVLIMILPRHETTHAALNARRLAQLKPSALVVNVGRGATVDEAALLDAVRSGKVAAAALDVTAIEPLPAESPLWDEADVLITPHVASGRPQEAHRLIELNVAALWGDGELRNVLNR